MAQLSSALAHELNQPLTAATNYVDTARTLLQNVSDPKIGKINLALEKGSQQIQRAGQIIRRLRSFVEKRSVSREAADINAVVQDAIALGLTASTDVNIKLKLRLAPELPRILMDTVQIQQVIVNLLRNAVEAMRTSEVKEIIISTLQHKTAVEVAVADTGPGIPAEVAARLFQPFTTTKSSGMGIGLTICRSILEAHGGNLSAMPRPGGGSIFRFHLPIEADKSHGIE